VVCLLRRDLDPLDLEIVERAVQGVSDAIRTCTAPVGLESDKELELALRLDLAEMVCASGVGDVDALLEILIERMREEICRARSQSQTSSLVLE
jgi:hypothetical protein